MRIEIVKEFKWVECTPEEVNIAKTKDPYLPVCCIFGDYELSFWSAYRYENTIIAELVDCDQHTFINFTYELEDPVRFIISFSGGKKIFIPTNLHLDFKQKQLLDYLKIRKEIND